MPIIECILPVILMMGVPYIRKTASECLRDETFETHIFGGLNFNQKTPQEQTTLIENTTYIGVLSLFVLLMAVVPFQSFVYYGVQDLYVALQIWILVLYNQDTPKFEKTVSVVCGIAYIVIQSPVLSAFVCYAMFAIEHVLVVEQQLFNGRLISTKSRRVVRIFDSILLACVWCFTLSSFWSTPRLLDAVIIPCVFWVQYTIHSQNKKKI